VEGEYLAKVRELDIIHPLVTCYVDCGALVRDGEGKG
jgi:hypothetical protein